MKILISSAYLAHELKKLNFEINHVQWVVVTNDNEMKIITNTEEINLDIHVVENMVSTKTLAIQNSYTYPQHDNRWDWLLSTVKVIDEQPIVLEISDNHLNLILNY